MKTLELINYKQIEHFFVNGEVIDKEVTFYRLCKELSIDDINLIENFFIDHEFPKLNNKIRLSIDINEIPESKNIKLIGWQRTQDNIGWCFYKDELECNLCINFSIYLTELCKENNIECGDGQEVDFYFKIENIE